MVTYTIVPLHGNYRATCVFEALSLNSKQGYEFPNNDFESFVTSVAVHNGAWEMLPEKYAFPVKVVSSTGKWWNKLLVVDNLFKPDNLFFAKLAMEGDGDDEHPVGASEHLNCAALVRGYGEAVYWDHVNMIEEEDFTREEVIRLMRGLLRDEDTPWRHNLFVMTVDVIREDNIKLLETPLLAEQWTFMDGSWFYITGEGLMDEADFSHWFTLISGIPQADEHFTEYASPSSMTH